MTDTIMTNATCKALSPVHSTPFNFSLSLLEGTPVPFQQPTHSVLDQFPIAAVVMAVLFTIAIVLRPRPKHLALKATILPAWAVCVAAVLSIGGSYWWVPKAAESVWNSKNVEFLEPGLSATKNLATVINDIVDLKPVKQWANLMQNLYDHHTVRLLLQHKQLMLQDETLKLIDKLIHAPHIQSRIASKVGSRNSDAVMQIDILTSVLRNLAHQSYIAGDLQTALRIATQGYHIDGTAQYQHEVLFPIKGQQALKALNAGDHTTAVNIIFNIQPAWDDPEFRQLIEVAQYELMKSYLSLGENTNWLSLASISKRLLEHHQQTAAGKPPSPHITCNLALLHGLQAIRDLDVNQPTIALAHLNKAKTYVADSDYVVQLMPIAHYRIGADLLQNSRYNAAALAFENANNLESRKEFACDAATAWRLAAFRAIDENNLNSAAENAKKARALCAKPMADGDLYTEIRFSRSLEHMKYGRWGKARGALKELLRRPKAARLARYHLSQLGHAQARHNTLVRSRHVVTIPSVTGQLCIHFTEVDGKVSCEAVALYNAQQEIGRSMNSKLTDVMFNLGDGYLAAYDGLGNNQYNTWEIQKDNSTQQWIDTDADYRPDFLQTFTEDRTTSQQQLSGRISMRFVGGLVNKKFVDIFSRPDTFLMARKNGRYFGRTETVDNTTRPNWRDYFVFDYKFGDTIDLYALDEDLFSDEFIDHIRLNTLPQSGYVTMDRGNITLAANIEKSTLPEGRYHGEKGQSVFSDPAFLIEQTPLATLVKKTYEEDGRAQIMATVAAIAIPETAIFTLMQRARFAEKLVVAWLGFDVTHQALNKSTNGAQ